MATTAPLDLSVWRNDDVYEFPIRVIGPDLTSVPLRAQIRLERDTPGAPLVDLATVTNGNAEGLRVAGVQLVDGRYVNDVRLRLNKSTRQALPYGGELGDAALLAWAMQIGGRTRLVGQVAVLAHAIDSDAAPANRPASYMSSVRTAPAAGATLTIASDDVVELVIDGADLASTASNEAQAAAESAQLAADTALAIGRFFPSQVAGEAGSTNGQLFSHPDGVGGLVYRQRTGGGSTVIAQAATAAQVQAAADAAADVQASVGRGLTLARVAPPAAAITAAAGGSGALTGPYTWRYTFIDAEGRETETGVASNTLIVSGKAVNLTGIAVSSDANVTGRRIYRTPAGETATEMGKRVAEIPNNTATTFTDNVADGSLGVRAPWINMTGGGFTLNGLPYFGTGFSTRLGVNSQPFNTNYATTSFGSNSFPVAQRVLRSEAFGVDAGEHLVSGEGLNLFGTHAGGSLVTATDTTAIGYGALQVATGAVACVAIGRAAASEATGTATNLTAIGAYALQLLTTGTDNTALGQSAGYGVTTGTGNTVMGSFAGKVIGTGNFNSLFGYQSGIAATAGGNAALGAFSLQSLTTGADNAAFGTNAGKSIITGTGNTFVGTNAGNHAMQKVDAFCSTVIGYSAKSTRDKELVLGDAAFTDFVVIAGVSFTKAQIANLLTLASA